MTELATETERQRVVGWRGDVQLTGAKKDELLKNDPELRREYRQTARIGQRVKEVKAEDPLQGVAPQGRPFWFSVPSLAVRAKQFELELEHKASIKGEDSKGGIKRAFQEIDAADVDDDAIGNLREDIKKKRVVLAEKQAELQRLADKEEGLLEVDEKEEGESKVLQSKVEKVRYEHGHTRGKLRSLELYFSHRYDDTKRAHQKKVATLQKTRALLQDEMAKLLLECRDLKYIGSGESAPLSPTSSRGLKK
mmetsp:Transcript_3478/g.7594  ORF Transcript_3478/g.7594 Transcript_3478/m.7594 type:complete len:251 (+) Transcript_3478:82-834(+)